MLLMLAARSSINANARRQYRQHLRMFSVMASGFRSRSIPDHRLSTVALASLMRRYYATIKSNNGNDTKKSSDNLDKLKIDVDELDKKLRSESPSVPEAIKMIRERRRVSDVFRTPAAVGIVLLAIFLFMMLSILREQKLREMEDERKKTVGKARIGGAWQLVDMDGKVGGSEQLKGHWLLMYFGFTNCPDVCPDSIEKMVEVVEILEKDEEKIEVLPIFISIDPERDSVKRIKEYCNEFSPKIMGYTGNKEEVDKVAKTFRVYYSMGPKTANTDDYIVDHTVIMYLIDPDGQFHDYYGQNRTANEIAKVIKLKIFKLKMLEPKKKWFQR